MTKIIFKEQEGLAVVTGAVKIDSNAEAYFKAENAPFSYRGTIYTIQGFSVTVQNGRFTVFLPPSNVAGIWEMTIPLHMDTPMRLSIPSAGTFRLEEVLVTDE